MRSWNMKPVTCNNRKLIHDSCFMIHGSGFTLIEVIIVIFMVGMGMLVLTSLFLNQNQVYQSQTAELTVTADARFALDEIDSSVRAADIVATSYSSYTTGTQVLVLQLPSINASNQIISATYDYFVYYLSGSSLLRQIFPNAASSRQASTKKMASNVTGLVFTYDNASMALVQQVTTDLTVQQSGGRYSRSISLSSKSKLRNN